ncbi:MAG: hypothetical protein ACR2M0_10065 [Chloroflexia bacterium]
MGKDRHESHRWADLGWLLLGVGLGSLMTYMMDPDRGRRRQALVRDRVVQTLGLARDGGGSSEGSDSGPTSPEWEIAHNDEGSITGPTS